MIRKLLELRVDMSAFAERETFHESDEKSRPEAVLLQEMFPGLHIDLLVDILRYNNWNVEAGMDAALAWTAAKENSMTGLLVAEGAPQTMYRRKYGEIKTKPV